jgi:hypothetical protein
MVTLEGSDGDVHEIGNVPGCSCTRESWRDVFAAYLVHAGLNLASGDGRNRMLHVLSDEWRARVRRQLDATERARARAEAMARHPAGSARRPVHLADRMDAAYRARRQR